MTLTLTPLFFRKNKALRLVFFITTIGLISVWLGRAVALQRWQYLVILALPLALLVFEHPKSLVWLSIGALFFGNRSDIPALAFWGRYLPTLGVGGLIAVVILKKYLEKHKPLEGLWILKGYALFGALLFFSAIYNGTGWRDIILGLLTNLRYPLFFWALLNAGFSPVFYRRVLKTFIALTLLQIPVGLVQFARGFSGDALTGTMGSNVPLVSVILASQCALLAAWLVSKQRRYLFATLALFLPVLLGGIQIGLIYFPFLVLFILFRHYGLPQLPRVILFGFLIVFLGTGVSFGAFTFIPTVNRTLSQVSEAYLQLEYYTDPINVPTGSIGRITILPFSFPLLLEEPSRLIWGFGPEAAQGGLISATFNSSGGIDAFSGMGIVCQKLLMRALACREPQSFKSLMEYGFLGTLFYILPLLMIWRQGSQLRRYAHSNDLKILCLFFQGSCFFYICLAFWYVGVWRFDSYSFLFWFLAAAVKVEGKEAKQLAEKVVENSI